MIIILALSACGQRIGLAPVVHGGKSERIQEGPKVKHEIGQAVVVKRGDALFKIARRHGVGLRNLIDANKLKPPFTIFPGQKLKLPRSDVHFVVRGETIYKIADHYDVEPGALVRFNGIEPPYKLYSGQRILIPGKSIGRHIRQKKPSPLDGKLTQKKLFKSNTKKLGRQSAPHSVSNAKKHRSVLKNANKSSRSSQHGFIWPVNGRVLSRFGTIGKGLQNDGINILAQKGTPVRAAQSGIVVYAGNELRGFGNLLLIKHPGSWISAYAHNSELLVQAGERVGRGQIVSKVGRTGSVDRAQLHFELRRGKRAVDPERFLGRRTAFLLN